MKCSKCSGVFEEIEYSGIKCNRCVSCRGILFSMLDHEHLKTIVGSESIDIGDAQVGKQYNRLHRIACPQCATRMIPMVDRDQPHIWYEACTTCYSVFFDAGEFTDFKEKTVLDFFLDLFAGERKQSDMNISKLAKGLVWLIGLSWGMSAYADEDLRMYLEGLRAGAPAVLVGQKLQSAQAVMAFYLDNNHQPVWTAGGTLAAELKMLPIAIAESQAHGFLASRYHHSLLIQPIADEQADYVTELLATDAFMTQARHRADGVVSPASLDADWHLVDAEHNVVEDLNTLATQGNGVEAYLRGLWPNNADYNLLIQERSRIAAQAETHTEPVTPGVLLKLGSTGPRVLRLKNRLLGPGEYTDVFDAALDRTVRIFQDSANLEPDGLVGAATLEMLNATRVDWIDRIDANLERWRWLPQQIPEDYISVNIAAFELKAVRSGIEEFVMRVVVGRPFRETPVFTEDMRYFVVNPYWNVPFKLATEDKLPKLKSNPEELAQTGYQVRPAGEQTFISVTDVDWSTVNKRNFNFLLRQQPGPANALGQIKFMMPNDFAIYLHDTNDRSLFLKRERSFSSGCIRLSEPEQLASWLLHREGRPEDAAKLSAQIAQGETRTINLRKPMPVYIVYFTASRSMDSNLVFRRDIYQRDSKIVHALRKD